MLLCIMLSMPIEHVFVKNLRTDGAMHYYNSSGSYVLIGYLDEDGDFITEKTIVSNAESKKADVQKDNNKIEQTGGSVKSTEFIKYNFINKPSVTGEDVFEYRSGKLVPGHLSRSWKFIPDLEGKVLDFSEYKFNDKAKRIYNLPGKFLPISEYIKLKQENK